MTGISDKDTEECYPISLKDFRTWLESKNKNEIIGQGRLACVCPLAKFLQKKVQNEESYVGKYSTYIPESEISVLDYSNPSWVVSFISSLDGTYDIGDITAKEAIEVLNEVENDLLN